jgi:hypothetical protein
LNDEKIICELRRKLIIKMPGLVPGILRFGAFEHDPEKWKSVFPATNARRLRGDHAQKKMAGAGSRI